MNAAPWPAFAGISFARGRLFETDDLDEARELCGRVFNPHRLQLLGPRQRLAAQMDHLRVGGVSLNRLTWGSPVAVDPDRLQSYYLLSLPIAGHARFRLDGQAFDVTPRCAAVVNAAQRFHFEASAGFDQIAVRFERRAVDEAWQALSGEAPARAINFEVPLPRLGAGWQALSPVLGLLAAQVDGRTAPAGLHHLHARLEDLLLTSLLLHQRPAAPLPRAASVGARHVRRAQEQMLQQLDHAWTLAGVARAGGVASRTLQAAFQAACGQGPMQWLREQRLDAVRAALAGDAATVTDTALRFGFTHLGEFAAAYRRRFGEAARDTWRRHH